MKVLRLRLHSPIKKVRAVTRTTFKTTINVPINNELDLRSCDFLCGEEGDEDLEELDPSPNYHYLFIVNNIFKG